MTSHNKRPLDGYRVVDFGQYIAGPAAGMMLADQGAEVVHIAPPRGLAGRIPPTPSSTAASNALAST